MLQCDSLGEGFQARGSHVTPMTMSLISKPEPGFTSKSWRGYCSDDGDMEMDAQITLPDGFVIELENGVTEKQIVDGTTNLSRNRSKNPRPSNRNDKEKF